MRRSKLYAARAFILAKCIWCYLQLAIPESRGQQLKPQGFDCSVSTQKKSAADVGRVAGKEAIFIFLQVLPLPLQLYSDLCISVAKDSPNQRSVQSSTAAT